MYKPFHHVLTVYTLFSVFISCNFLPFGELISANVITYSSKQTIFLHFFFKHLYPRPHCYSQPSATLSLRFLFNFLVILILWSQVCVAFFSSSLFYWWTGFVFRISIAIYLRYARVQNGRVLGGSEKIMRYISTKSQKVFSRLF